MAHCVNHAKILPQKWPGSIAWVFGRCQETDQGQCGGALRGLQDVDTWNQENYRAFTGKCHGDEWTIMGVYGNHRDYLWNLWDFMVVNSKFTNNILTNYLEFTLRWFKIERYGSHGPWIVDYLVKCWFSIAVSLPDGSELMGGFYQQNMWYGPEYQWNVYRGLAGKSPN